MGNSCRTFEETTSNYHSYIVSHRLYGCNICNYLFWIDIFKTVILTVTVKNSKVHLQIGCLGTHLTFV